MLPLPGLVAIVVLMASACGGGTRVITPGVGPAPASGPQSAPPGAAVPGQPIEVPKTDATPPPPPRGVIAGAVTSFATDEPIARARVILTTVDPAGLDYPRVALTDADGRYRFTDLPANNAYLITVSKTGFAPRAFGEAPPSVPPQPVALAQDEVKEGLSLQLMPHVSIGGRILDEDGTPFAGALVEAMRPIFEGDRRTLITVAEAVSDDRGEFRLIGLPPGQYYVSASDPAYLNIGDKDGQLFYSPTFYPGVVFPDEATRITLDPGVVTERLEFKLRIIRPARVRGSISTPIEVGGLAKPLMAAAVIMSPMRNDQFSLFTITEPQMEPGGEFLFSNVPPGRYRIMAGGETEREGIARFSLYSMDVAGQDRDNADMVLSRGANVFGTVEWDTISGRIPTDLSGILVRMPMEDGNAFGDSVTGYLTGANEWNVRGVMTGRHFFRVQGLPPGWHLKRVEYQGGDITDVPWMFNYEETVSGFKIVLTNRATIVRGFLLPRGKDDVQSYAVVVFSTNPLNWRPQSRYTAITYPDPEGRYEFRGLPPGQYHLAATRSFDHSDLGNPEAFDLLLGQKGVETFSLAENQVRPQHLSPLQRDPARER